MDFKDLAQMRRSHRKFTEEAVSKDDIKLILRSALMSPTSKGQRNWQFVVVEDKEKVAALSTAKDLGGQFLASAPVCIAVFGDASENDCWVEDGSIAAISMQYQAEDLGLGSCWAQMRARGLKDGTPATYATVALRAADAKVEDYAVQNSMVESELRTDKNGRFEMEWPDSGDYRLTVTKDGFAYSKVYKAKDLAKLDTLRLEATASISSKVTLRTGEEFLWVGVYGLDLLVKTNDAGSYVLPSVPAKDSLDIYFVMPDSAFRNPSWRIVTVPFIFAIFMISAEVACAIINFWISSSTLMVS